MRCFLVALCFCLNIGVFLILGGECGVSTVNLVCVSVTGVCYVSVLST